MLVDVHRSCRLACGIHTVLQTENSWRPRRGIVAVGFFATKAGVAAAYPQTPLVDWGVFYGGCGNQLGIQILGAVAIGTTTLALNGIGFGMLRAMGCLRVPAKVWC